MRDLLVGLLLSVLPVTAAAQFCPGCIQNSAAPQNAQMNIGTATIRGTLTVNELVAAALSLGSVTAATFTGDGSHLTILNATQLSSGTVPSARLSGPYTGITAVGALASGTWQGSPVGTQYGGTGKNWVNVSTGSIPYFSSVGTMSTLSPGDPQALLQTNGSAAPVWTSSPAVSGIHIYGINPSQLAAGTLPTSVIVTSNSIPYVAGASVIGNISGAAGSYTGPIALSQLSTGTLPSSVVASSIVITGVRAGTYGGPSIAAQYTVGTDGRISYSTQVAIAILPSQISTGTWPAGVFVPAANITSGTLAGNVVASSIAASGVTPGTYGSATIVPQITIGGDGRITSAAQYAIPGVSSTTAFVDVDNNWRHAQTSVSSWTFRGITIGLTGPNGYIISQSSISTSGGFFGNGSALTGIPSSGSIVGVYLPLAGGTMTGQLVVANLSAPTDVSSFTVTGANGIKTPNLLIGAGTSAGANLDVEGSAQFGSGVAKSSFSAAGELTFPNNVGITAVNSGGNPFSMIRFTNGDTLRIQTDSPGDKVTIGGNPGVTATFVNGTVGISTGLPQATLDVNGNTLVRGNIVLTSSITLFAGQQILVGSNANCGTTPGLCVDELTSGNVAFLRNGNGAQLRLLNGTAPDVGIYMAAQDNSSTNNSLNINFSGTHLFTVANDGKVGIGVLGNAATLLDVTGNAQFGSGVSKSTISATGAFTLASGAALTLSGSAGTIVSGSSVTGGAFYGYGGNLSGVTASAVAAANVQAGTLGPAVIASSVAATGVTAATYGSATQAPQIAVAGDGRITSASNVTVTPAAGSITSGTLGAAVIASSVAATAVTAGSYGSASSVGTFTVGGDGRLTAASNTSIAIAESAVTNLVTDLAAKASTGTDNSITRLQSLRTMDLGVTASSVTATNGVFIPAGKQLIVGTNANGGTGPALEADESNSGALVHLRNSTTGGLVRFLNGSGVEQGIFADSGNDATDANSTLRLTNGGATKILWVGNGGKMGIGTESPATRFHCSTCVVTIDGTGAGLTVLGTTFYAYSNGNVDMNGVPRVQAAEQAAGDLLVNNIASQIFFQTPTRDNQHMYGQSTASGTWTVPASMPGDYRVHSCVVLQSASSVQVHIYINGVDTYTSPTYEGSGNTFQWCVDRLAVNLSAGDTIKIFVLQNSGVNKTTVGNTVSQSFIEIQKQ